MVMGVFKKFVISLREKKAYLSVLTFACLYDYFFFLGWSIFEGDQQQTYQTFTKSRVGIHTSS